LRQWGGADAATKILTAILARLKQTIAKRPMSINAFGLMTNVNASARKSFNLPALANVKR
jgi:hypothetical protein